MRKILRRLSVAFCAVLFLNGCSTASNPADFSKESLELNPADARALNDFLQGNVESDGVPGLKISN